MAMGRNKNAPDLTKMVLKAEDTEFIFDDNKPQYNHRRMPQNLENRGGGAAGSGRPAMGMGTGVGGRGAGGGIANGHGGAQ